jgi:hypothetical protein
VLPRKFSLSRDCLLDSSCSLRACALDFDRFSIAYFLSEVIVEASEVIFGLKLGLVDFYKIVSLSYLLEIS